MSRAGFGYEANIKLQARFEVRKAIAKAKAA